jgi:glucose/arabinose dehydrogenase
VRIWIALLLAAFVRPVAFDGDVVAPGFTQTTVASGLALPTAFAFLPDGRLLVTEQAGDLKLVDDGAVSTIATIPVAMCSDFETGLLGIAVDPDFANNGYVYLFRTKDGDSGCFDLTNRFCEVVRITIANDTVDLQSLVVLLSGIRTDTGYHDGGALRIGPDSKLYVGAGETGVGDFGGGPPGTSTNPYAQDLNVLEGKILRINLDGTIPSDNPFVGIAGMRPEIFAYGFRNPWRLGFDPNNNNLWVGDVGEDTAEELDVVTSGGNFGWPLSEAKLPKVAPGTVAPAFSYLHEIPGSLGSCVSGIAFAPPEFGTHAGGFYGGFLFFGDFDEGHIYRAALDKTRSKVSGKAVPFVNNTDGVVDLSFGPDGALYYLSYEAGELRRVGAPDGGGQQFAAGKSLSMKSSPTSENQYSISVQGAAPIDLGGALDNPVAFGGSVRIVANGYEHTAALPAEHWKFLGKLPDKVTGFVYKADSDDAASPYKSIQILAGKSYKITGSSDDFAFDLSADPGPVHVDLILGGRKFCAEFGGETKLTIDKSFTAKNAPAPLTCPP